MTRVYAMAWGAGGMLLMILCAGIIWSLVQTHQIARAHDRFLLSVPAYRQMLGIVVVEPPQDEQKETEE